MKRSLIREKIGLGLVGTIFVLLLSSNASAETVKINRVRQMVSSNPSKSQNTELKIKSENGNRKNQLPQPSATPPAETSAPASERVIVQEQVDIVEEACNCAPLPEPVAPVAVKSGFGFPWAVLGLGAIPPALLCCGNDDKTPTPQNVTTPTPTNPSPTPTTPTPTPITPTPTPITPTPTPPPVPEPMTVLLFGTGLAGIGAAVRRKMRRETSEDTK